MNEDLSALTFRPVRLLYNGSDAEGRHPSVDPASHHVLAGLPVGTLLDIEVRPAGMAVTPLRAVASRNSKYFFLRRTLLPTSWPGLPNAVAYEARWRVIQGDRGAQQGELLAVLEERRETVFYVDGMPFLDREKAVEALRAIKLRQVLTDVIVPPGVVDQEQLVQRLLMYRDLVLEALS